MPSVALLFTLLLALSVDACNARHLRMHAKDPSSRYNESSKVSEKVNPSENSVHGNPAGSTSSKGVALEKKQGFLTVEHTQDVKEKNEGVSGALQASTLVKVTWRVPRGGAKEHPGFDADYVGPTTNPPSHN
ncbi:unnamed protein product [Musa textilis]